MELGEELLYGRCLLCAQEARQAPGSLSLAGRSPLGARLLARQEMDDIVSSVRDRLAVPGRIVLTRREIRAVITLVTEADPSFEPVRRPDKGRPATRWYAKLAGWDVSRVERGLTAQEAAGFWLDSLEVGRVPPVSHAWLDALLAVIAGKGQDS
jgi:hypothetical protein